MKSRLVLLAISFAILAIVGIACDDARSIAPHASTGAATYIDAQQTPTEDLPVIVRTPTNAAASAQTILDFTPHQNVHQALRISTRTPKTFLETQRNVATPLSIPLLI